MEYINFIRKPSIDMIPGIKVTKETDITYENERVKQTIKDLVFHSVTLVEGEGFTSTYDTTITLEEGDFLLFVDEIRGYVKPVEEFVEVKEAIEELNCIKDM